MKQWLDETILLLELKLIRAKYFALGIKPVLSALAAATATILFIPTVAVLLTMLVVIAQH